MRNNGVECAEIRSGFASGHVPEGAAVAAHVQACPHCRALFEDDARLGRALSLGVVPAPDAGALFELVSRDLEREVGWRSRIRSLSTPTRVITLLMVAVTLAAFQLLLVPRRDLASYAPFMFWGIGALLLVALGAGAWRLARGPLLPLGSSRAGWGLLLLALPALLALVAPLGAGPPRLAAEGGDWGSPAVCFGYGAALVIPVLLWWWLSERRDSVPLAGLMTAGAVAGLAANLLLHAHCSSVHLGHLLLGHAGIGVAWALALSLLFGRIQRSS